MVLEDPEEAPTLALSVNKSCVTRENRYQWSGDVSRFVPIPFELSQGIFAPSDHVPGAGIESPEYEREEHEQYPGSSLQQGLLLHVLQERE
jgi:hypothetical protein